VATAVNAATGTTTTEAAMALTTMAAAETGLAPQIE